jgi:hypothetical protein
MISFFYDLLLNIKKPISIYTMFYGGIMGLLKKRLVFCLFVVSTLVSCGRKESFKEINWVKGLNSEPVDYKIDASLTLDHKSSVDDKRINIYKQLINNKEVDGSYFKKIDSEQGDTIGLVGQTTDLKVDKSKVEIFEKRNLALVKEEFLNKYPEFRKNDIQDFNWIYVPSKNFLIPMYKLSFTNRKTEIYEVQFDSALNIYSNKKMGSQFSDVEAMVFPKGPKMSQLEAVILKSVEVENGIRGLNFKVSSLLNSKFESPREIVKIPISDDRFDQVQVSFFIQKSYEWFAKTFNSKIPFMIDIQVNVGAPEKSNTAFYYANKIRFGSGDDIVYSKIPRDPTIIIHESNHAIIDYLAHLPFDREGGSLNEGFADFLTTLQLNNPNLGEVSFLKGSFRRTVKNELKFTDRKGSLYGDSAVASGLLWNLKETFGDEIAGRIAVNTLMLLGPRSDFIDFRNKIYFSIKSELKEKNLETAEKILKDRNWL